MVDDHALVMNGTVRGYAHVAGNACICADKVTEHEPTVQEHASVYGVVAGNVCVEESAIVLPGARIENPTPDRFRLLATRIEIERSYYRMYGRPEPAARDKESQTKASNHER